MKHKNILHEKAFRLAVGIKKYSKYLCEEHKDYNQADQLARSGTSVIANLKETEFAISNAEFYSKLQIALKECNETEMWLNLFKECNEMPPEFEYLLDDANEVLRMLIASSNTMRKKLHEN